MDSKLDPVNSVFSTPEVREMILKNLDVASLLNCRIVSKSWNTTASSVLKKRPLWIKRKWDSETFGRLYKCVESSTNFPFCRLDLTSTAKRSANVNYDNATKLFTRFGKIFTHLRTNSSFKWHAEMLSNLLKHTSQLDYLEIGNVFAHVKAEENPEFCLPMLRTLSFRLFYNGGNERVLVDIIRAAPMLQEIQHVRCSSAIQMAALRKTQKLTLVSSLTLSPGIETGLCSDLAVNPLYLTAVTVEHDSQQVCASLKAIVIQSQNTLKKLKFFNFCASLDGDLPVFHQLEELDFTVVVKDVDKHSTPVFPFMSKNLFPKLKRIRFDAFREEITEEVVRKYLWGVCDNPLESVAELQIVSYCGPNVIICLAKYFPRVTYISMDYFGCKYGSRGKSDSNIWLLKAFPFLSKLDINEYPYRYGNMDSFLTGIPPEIVTKLRNAPKQSLSPCLLEILQPYENILQLKNLKELTVTIRPIRCFDAEPFMTLVSIWYALELIPDLHANFLYCSRHLRNEDHYVGFQDAFGQVKDYVTIRRCFCGMD